jgi:hypothetical protein
MHEDSLVVVKACVVELGRKKALWWWYLPGLVVWWERAERQQTAAAAMVMWRNVPVSHNLNFKKNRKSKKRRKSNYYRDIEGCKNVRFGTPCSGSP